MRSSAWPSIASACRNARRERRDRADAIGGAPGTECPERRAASGATRTGRGPSGMSVGIVHLEVDIGTVPEFIDVSEIPIELERVFSCLFIEHPQLLGHR